MDELNRRAGEAGQDIVEARSYVDRMCRHMGVLIAYEDSSLPHDEDRVMLALTFMMAHCEMVAGELRFAMRPPVDKE